MYPNRKSPRIPNFSYTGNFYYFITICTYNRKCIFGNPGHLNVIGEIVQKHILNMESYYKGITVQKFVIMPNHVHMIIASENAGNTDMRYVVALLKTGATKEIRKRYPNMKVWQRSFHDHVIRDLQRYEKIWAYIDNNPLKWEEDCFFQNM